MHNNIGRVNVVDIYNRGTVLKVSTLLGIKQCNLSVHGASLCIPFCHCNLY